MYFLGITFRNKRMSNVRPQSLQTRIHNSLLRCYRRATLTKLRTERHINPRATHKPNLQHNKPKRLSTIQTPKSLCNTKKNQQERSVHYNRALLPSTSMPLYSPHLSRSIPEPHAWCYLRERILPGWKEMYIHVHSVQTGSARPRWGVAHGKII